MIGYGNGKYESVDIGSDIAQQKYFRCSVSGKPQPYINSTINDLVREKKLIRIDTRPYTVHVPKPGEAIPEVKD